jgi:hypothetical protein
MIKSWVYGSATPANYDLLTPSLWVLHSNRIVGWDEFEVGQVAGPSVWYCGVDAMGRIRSVLLKRAEDKPDQPED